MRRAAVVTIGSELTAGLRVDTNTAEVARELSGRGFLVVEAVSVPDSVEALAATLERLCAACQLVVTTGGLGPTHDDVTREAASQALELPLLRDDRLAQLLEPIVARHREVASASQVLTQADVLAGARVIDATTGTAPGLVVPTAAGELALLPGPPTEMRPMLAAVLERYPRATADHRELGVVGMPESDVQLAAQRALAGVDGVGFTVLARPGDVRVLLLDEGCGAHVLDAVSDSVAEHIGSAVYTRRGESLAESVVSAAVRSGATLGVAESCTGGLVAAELTSVSGASQAVRGGVVAYDDSVKGELLGVEYPLLAMYGAVSAECAGAMAEGALELLGASIAVSVTGIAGPGGGSAEKPVGLVWFGIADDAGVRTERREFPPADRGAVRARATATALDLLRQALAGR